MGKNIKGIKTALAALALSAAVFSAGCGDAGPDSGNAQSRGEGNGEGQDGGQQEAPGEDGGQQDGGEAYLDGIQAADYVKLGEYKGIEVEQAPPEVTEESRDSYIEHMLRRNPDRGVIEGDTVNIDYAGTLDGVAFDGGTAAGQDLTIGSGRFVPGFEEGLIGAKVGETVEVPLTFPENYHEGLAGEDVVFTVTVNSITASEPQELTDEFVQRQGLGLNTVEELRQYAYDALYEDAVANYEQRVEDAAMEAAYGQCEFTEEPPQAMVERHVNILMSNLSSQAAGYGLTLDQFMEQYGMDEEAYRQEFRRQAEEYTKQQIMIKAIADAEGLQVTEEELQAELQPLLETSGLGNVEELGKIMDVDGYREYMLSMKVLKLLGENAVVAEAGQGNGEEGNQEE